MLELDGASLRVDQIARAATDSTAAVRVTDAARSRAAASHDYAEHVAGFRPLYGRSTGVGANRGTEVATSDAHALRLLRSHSTAAGGPRSRRRVRAMLVIRLNQLAAGGSGVSPRLLDALTAQLATDAQPTILELGSIGTGDLSALATAALALAGEAVCEPRFATPIRFTAGDALPFMSSNAATIADAALACSDLRMLSSASLVVGALSFVALDGNREALSPSAVVGSPFPGVSHVATTMGALVGDRPPARIQDPFGLRALPQVHGAFVDALARAAGVVETMANAPSENPLFLADSGVAHHGGFHAVYLAQALDGLTSALAQTTQLSLARLTYLNDPSLTGLASFLAGPEPGASGAMILEYVAASALAELRGYGIPVGLQGVALSQGVEDDASFASLAARNALRAVDSYSAVLGCELVAAVRALRLADVETAQLTPGLAAALRTAASLPGRLNDRSLTDDISIAQDLLPTLAQPTAL
ncbi:histidine ammonia-lyase [Jatrophihabitans sp. GAS493]|uniref:aromatic amino acid lyase n=1 Tax=Jatrophihabitans sp. GAS493 TaxID=1907575 RepID=UPI000BC00ABF|nr:aromatic amino acid lyase [Jatrophihabitans sp. GAS493]SOD71528.1 histidine ammonia-lyase [Jatrophihabitans sp. GAS493]